MLTYLNGCSFNTGESPHGIVRFSNDEAVQTELSRYVREVIEKDEVTNKPEVRQIDNLLYFIIALYKRKNKEK